MRARVDEGVMPQGGALPITTQEPKLPRSTVVIVLGLCIAPFACQVLGIELGVSAGGDPLPADAFEKLRGAFIHTLLEWSAFCIALFTAALAFVHFKSKRDVVTPVIALALVAAGSMDAFHTLAADRLISANAANTDLVPFTWAMCRLFNSVICMLGVGVLLATDRTDWGRHAGVLVGLAGLGFGLIAYVVIALCATSESLPQTQFPDSMVTRPWDVYPFGVYLLSSFMFVRFYKRYPSIFTYSLVLSTVPDLATQAHMALGSSQLFDADFNAAHFLKLVAYGVPCLGLIFDYQRTHIEELALVSKLNSARERLVESNAALQVSNEHLERSNEDLQQFAYVASHDLKAPLRGIHSLTSFIEEDLEDGQAAAVPGHLKKMRGRLKRLEALIDGILKYSRLEATNHQHQDVDVGLLLQELGSTVLPPESSFHVEVEGTMPILKTNQVLLSQVFSNLMSNAINHHDGSGGVISICCKPANDDAFVSFSVSDDGPGIPDEFRDKVFDIFQTLEGRDTREGSGIGLSLVRKLVLGQGGQVTVGAAIPRGARFDFTWPKQSKTRQSA